MRTVTFSNAEVQKLLNQQWMSCLTNTMGDRNAGASLAHAPTDPAGPCGIGAGRQNVQTLFLTPKGEIFHVVSGYLDAKTLLEEIGFARQLWEQIKTESEERKRIVVEVHRRRLQELGYSEREIAEAKTPAFDLRLKQLSPSDLGFDVPDFSFPGLPEGMPQPFSSDIQKWRVLKDHDFVMGHPLISIQQFNRQVSQLVGEGSTFFGSHAALNGLPEEFNEQAERLRQMFKQR
jgi:hypothetical protein